MKQFPNKLVPGIESKEWKAYKKAGETLNKAEEEVDAKLKEFCVIIKSKHFAYPLGRTHKTRRIYSLIS